jgi:hypothetical protein
MSADTRDSTLAPGAEPGVKQAAVPFRWMIRLRHAGGGAVVVATGCGASEPARQDQLAQPRVLQQPSPKTSDAS